MQLEPTPARIQEIVVHVLLEHLAALVLVMVHALEDVEMLVMDVQDVVALVSEVVHHIAQEVAAQNAYQLAKVHALDVLVVKDALEVVAVIVEADVHRHAGTVQDVQVVVLEIALILALIIVAHVQVHVSLLVVQDALVVLVDVPDVLDAIIHVVPIVLEVVQDVLIAVAVQAHAGLNV